MLWCPGRECDAGDDAIGKPVPGDDPYPTCGSSDVCGDEGVFGFDPIFMPECMDRILPGGQISPPGDAVFT
jgi:hypothetical protein